jgi:endonuclease IV
MSNNYLLGGHVRLDEIYNAEFATQCFITNNRAHMTTTRVANIKTSKRPFEKDLPRIAHCSYVTRPWSTNFQAREESMQDIRLATEACKYLNIQYYLIHLPITVESELFFTECVKQFEPSCTLLFEIDSHRPKASEHGLTMEPYNLLLKYNMLLSKSLDNYGICLDTAHMFARGMPITTASDVRVTFAKLYNLPIKAIHLNGNKREFGSGSDVHTGVGEPDDYIWSKDMSGAIEIIKWAFKNNVPIILERKGLLALDEYKEERKRLIIRVRHSRDYKEKRC